MTSRHVIAALALLFFLAPLGLRAAGVTATTFENRPFAPRPSLDAGWEVFDQTTRFFTDRMPLREQAVRAQSWAARNVLDVAPTWRRDLLEDQANTAALPQDKQLERERPTEPPPTPQPPQPGAAAPAPPSGSRVLDGRDGWLFLADDLQRACAAALPWPAVVGRLELIARGIRESGRDVVVAIAPDKSAIYPELLGERARERYACAARERREYWPLMERSREPALLALRQALLDAKRRSGEALYRSTDSHWNAFGASVALRAILARLDAGVRVAPGEIVRRPPLEYTGDLNTLLGIAEQSTTPDRVVRRPRGAPKLRGKTVFISDSYGLYTGPLLVPYAEQLTQLPWPTTPPATMVAEIEAADHVIIQIIERELTHQLGDVGPFAALMEAIRADLPPKP